MAEEILHGTNIRTVLQKMSGKRMPEDVRCNTFVDTCARTGGPDDVLKSRVDRVVAPFYTRLGISARFTRGK